MPPLIIANWKSHKNAWEAQKWVEQVAGGSWNPDKAKLILAPSFPLLPFVYEQILKHQLPLDLAVQDLSAFPAGAYTGDVSTRNLDHLGVKFVILGHSERRQYHHESSQELASKVDLALSVGWQPIVCVDDDNYQEQLGALAMQKSEKIWFAYEPQAAIGTGRSADLGQVAKMKNQLSQSFGQSKFIYGGSVDETNINEYLVVCDGALVGSASLEPNQFVQLLQQIK